VVAFYCYQTIILLLADQSCSKPLPISAETMTTVLQIAVAEAVITTSARCGLVRKWVRVPGSW
jgi:hypothetical protein